MFFSGFCVSDYRPISLPPNISKLFEKLIKNRLSKFLEENKCLFSRQFGFRNKHSTTHALIDLTETIRKAIDDNEYACGVFQDFKKAFDTDVVYCTVNHGIDKTRTLWSERACFEMVHLLSYRQKTIPVLK